MATVPAPLDEKDIDVVLVTGAGASCAFGVNQTTLPLMGDWSEALVRRLAEHPSGYLDVTGLERGLDGETFERRLGRFLQSVEAFGKVGPLLRPISSLPIAGLPPVADDWWDSWHRDASFQLAQVVGVIHDSLYGLFADPSYDRGLAQQAYGWLLNELGVGPPSRFVLATTNYDTIGESALAALGHIPDVGDVELAAFQGERAIRVDRLLDGMPRYTPVLHLHGRVGWFRRRDGRAASIFAQSYDAQYGVPLVMLPDLEKDYATDPVISDLWVQFAEALSRARLVLVLGHSLHDEALVRVLAENVSPPARLAVTVLAAADDPDQPADEAALDLRGRLHERLPDAQEILLRFAAEPRAMDGRVRDWAAK